MSRSELDATRDFRRPRFDVFGPALAAAAGVVYVLHGFHGYLSRDLGLYAYSGQQFAEGVPPYVALLNRSGPLAQMIPGLGAVLARWTGGDDVIWMRYVCLVLAVIGVWVAYLFGRDLFRSRTAGVVTALALIINAGFITYASGGPREKTAMVLFMLCAMWAMTRERWFLTGVGVALSTLCWQPVFFPAIAAALAGALLLATGRRVRAAVATALGGAVTTGLFIGYFVAVGALDDFVSGFIGIHLHYTHQPGLASDAQAMWVASKAAFGISLWVLIAGLVLLPALTVLHLIRDRRGRLPRLLLAFTVGEIAAAYWSWKVFNGWADAMVLIPFAMVGIGATADLLLRRASRRTTSIAVVLATIATLIIGGQHAIATRTDLLDRQRALTDNVIGVLGPDTVIWSIEAPQPLVFTHARNPVRYQMFLAGLQDYMDAKYPGGLSGFSAMIERRNPTLITVSRTPQPPYWIADMLATNYDNLGRSGGFNWYVANTVPQPTRDRVRELVANNPIVDRGDPANALTGPQPTHSGM